METKKCPYCAEEIKEEAIKCKHCWSEILDSEFDDFKQEFDSYEEWLNKNYPQYKISHRDYENKSITVDAKYKNFSLLALIILLLLWVIPWIIYALVASWEKRATIKIDFYDTGRVKKVNNRLFKYLLVRYNKYEKTLQKKK